MSTQKIILMPNPRDCLDPVVGYDFLLDNVLSELQKKELICKPESNVPDGVRAFLASASNRCPRFMTLQTRQTPWAAFRASWRGVADSRSMEGRTWKGEGALEGATASS